MLLVDFEEHVTALDDSSDSDSEGPEVKQEPAAALDVAFDWSVAENPQLLRAAWSRAAENESSSDEEVCVLSRLLL